MIQEVAVQYQPKRWTLAALFPEADDPSVNQALTELERTVDAIEALRPQLSAEMSGEAFAAAMNLIETFTSLSYRLGSYGQLWFSEDTQNQKALAFMGRMEQLLTEVQNRILFFSLWWKGLDDATAERLLAFAGDSRYHLEQERLFKDYTLSEPEEKIINIKDINGVNALTTLYDMITNKFVFELEVEGEKQKLSRSELMVHVRNCLLYTSPSPRDGLLSRMPSSA